MLPDVSLKVNIDTKKINFCLSRQILKYFELWLFEKRPLKKDTSFPRSKCPNIQIHTLYTIAWLS